jgi:hypothetical protein
MRRPRRRRKPNSTNLKARGQAGVKGEQLLLNVILVSSQDDGDLVSVILRSRHNLGKYGAALHIALGIQVIRLCKGPRAKTTENVAPPGMKAARGKVGGGWVGGWGWAGWEGGWGRG